MTSHRKFGVGPRCATWLKEVYPLNRGKLIARDFGVSESTAWRWLAGEAPTVRALEEMAARWGRTFLEYVFDGPGRPADSDLARLIAIRDELDRREEIARRERETAPVEEKVKYSRAVPESRQLPAIDWTDANALRKAELTHLRDMATHLLGQKLGSDPGPGRVGRALPRLRAMLRID